MMTDYCWSIKRDLNDIEGFISTGSLNKILVALGIFKGVIFKDLGFDFYCKNSISQ